MCSHAGFDPINQMVSMSAELQSFGEPTGYSSGGKTLALLNEEEKKKVEFFQNHTHTQKEAVVFIGS